MYGYLLKFTYILPINSTSLVVSDSTYIENQTINNKNYQNYQTNGDLKESKEFHGNKY